MNAHLLSVFDAMPHDDTVFIKGYVKDSYTEITRAHFRKKVFALAAFLKTRNLSVGDRVVVIAEKCPETLVAFMSILVCDAVVVPVCETLSFQELKYILENAVPKIVICSDILYKKISSLVYLNEDIYCIPFSAVANLSSRLQTIDCALLSSLNPDDPAFILYTSGSTGVPKGVVLSHENIVYNARVSAEHIGMNKNDACMSVLPYWHSFALTAEIFTMMIVGGKIYVPKNKVTFMKDVNICKPTILFSIPRLAEFIKVTLEQGFAKKSLLQKKMIQIARVISLRYYLQSNKKLNLLNSVLYKLAKKIVLSKIKHAFGGNLNYFVGGGAPLDESLQRFFMSIDIPMYQGYGLTEASPVISINAPHNFKVGTSGKIISWLMQEHGGDYTFLDEQGNKGKQYHGELLVKGKCVMQGYWNLPEETLHVLKNGWLHTGDIGCLDKEGFLILSGRKKNLICLKTGEKFYPEFVEEKIKSSSYITHAMIVGEGASRPSVCVTINEEMFGEVSKERMHEVIHNEIQRLTQEFEHYQRPYQFCILPELSQEEGLLTNTMKIRRHKVMEKHKKEISEIVKV